MSIEELRKKINLVDANLIDLLAQRRELSKNVIQDKNENNNPIRDEKREEELLNRLVDLGKEKGVDQHFLTKVFYEIIEDSIRLQQSHVLNPSKENSKNERLTIAIQGIEGAYSYLASQKYFAYSNKELEFVSKKLFSEVVESVEKGEADYAVLPIENTTSGGINEVYDLLLHTTLSIVGEETFQVKHCLVASEDVSIHKIKKIYAHYQAAAQCSVFLTKIPEARIEYFADTAMSVQKISEEKNPEYAAIASEEAAKLFNVNIIRKGIANQDENHTRFIIVSRNRIKVDNRLPAKTSLVMATSHSPGSLVKALSVFDAYKINLTKLESRPILGNPWEEMFYVDFEGNTEDENVQNLLDDLGPYLRFFKVLGSYPSQVIKKTKLNPNTPTEEKEESNSILKEIQKPIIKKSAKSKSYKLASREYKEEDTIIKVRDVEIGGSDFVVIGGPCSVESESQIFSCAHEVKVNGAQILRGGCFKPRTSPYSFQGLEWEGLNYLEAAGKEYDLPVITEALAPEQVQRIAKQSDIIQIGARNMQNFSLLKEAGKVHVPILLKRGMMSSIDELLNAAEYILAQGNRQVILMERGIRTFETATRNTLDLSAIPVLKELTHLPIMVDPSHAIGERDKIPPMALASKIVGAHGIMVEFHPEPEKALSDGPQALRYPQFAKLMQDLKKLQV
ncbi:MAG: bifunctional 3-deoxy-7-phosphoheptulonate synthase/chorismate mutase [Bacteroidetes bacterium]|nr:bifunctional 3-deoxy-7-phosphoheptulonate synthase/chorismate mutase [Bacteroidota bacterium]MBU1115669.1 bifunctional 3-deoxy-7-phosphoheptulonate synthase/chorismate mutase [Bacteroidota bacterium]MBU1799018.1 bifunctional 3-deoxy-7-phosphoheptulonate synthase/chorismate mutase [Bacteroidota bacterium]